MGLSIDNELNEYRKTFSEYDKALYQKSFEVMRKNEEWVAADNIGSPNVDKLWAEFYELVLEHREVSDKWPDMATQYIDSHNNQTIVPYLIDKLISFNYDIETVESYIGVLTDSQSHSLLGELMQIRYDIAKLNGGAVGSEAMDFSLRSADGRQVMLAECFDNGYVLLDFWASWCGPCIKEIPKLWNLHEEYGDKLKIISISVDNETTDWRNAVEKLHLTDWQQLIIDYPVDTERYYFTEQADMSLAYGIEQIPCFMLVDKNGIIVGRWSHLTHEVVDDIVSIIGR